LLLTAALNARANYMIYNLDSSEIVPVDILINIQEFWDLAGASYEGNISDLASITWQANCC